MPHLLHVVALALAGLAQGLRLDFTVAELENDPLKHRHELKARVLELPLYNDLPKQRYLINVTVGTPPRSFAVLADTGSGDLWFPHPDSPGCAPDPCPFATFDPNTSSSIVDLGYQFNGSYGNTPDNIMLGEYYNDTITLGNVTLLQQQFAINQAPPLIVEGGLWGIMGLSTRYQTGAVGTDAPPLSVFEHLYEAGVIAKKLFSVWLDSQDAKTGTILFGEVDDSKYAGELRSTPVITQGRNKTLVEWAVNLASVARHEGSSNETTKLTNATTRVRTVVDTGSPNLYLPVDIYNTIATPLNATMHPEANTPYVACSYRNSTASIDFGFAGVDGLDGPSIRVPYRELIYPFGLPASLGEVRDDDGTELCYFGVIPYPPRIFLIGATLLRSAYVVFDAEAAEIRMAQVEWS